LHLTLNFLLNVNDRSWLAIHAAIHNILLLYSDAAPRRGSLRSANRNCLTVPRCRLSTFGCRAFHCAGATVWNLLPDELKNSDSFDSFKRFMKTILFSRYTSLTSALEVIFYNEVRYINLRCVLLYLTLLANFRVERCRTDDLMPNVPISCLPPSLVDPKVH